MAKGSRQSEDWRLSLLHDLTDVSPSKPVGYLPLNTIKKFVKREAQAMAAEATAGGLATREFSQQDCCIKSGALYVYHRAALADLLQERADAVTAAGLPLDPDQFIAVIAAVWFEADHPAYAIIKAAFADESGCSDRSKNVSNSG